jgi:cytochrome c553
MKTFLPVLMFAAATITAGCAVPDRSRNLNDSTVPARALAEQVCSNCHGLDGNSVSPNFPRLAGQMPAYTVEQLTAFRSHGRSDPPGFEYMWGLTRHLTDSQIKGLAEYFAQQRPTANAPGDPVRVAAGREVFEKGIPAANIPPCATCHGAGAQGNEGFPRLAGQHAGYLAKQLVVFQKTDQRPDGAVMKTITHDLTRQNIDAVAEYLQSLPPR